MKYKIFKNGALVENIIHDDIEQIFNKNLIFIPEVLDLKVL